MIVRERRPPVNKGNVKSWRVPLRGLSDCRAETEQLGIGHQGSGSAVGKTGEGSDQCGARRGADADLGLAAEVRHREPSAVELTEPKVELDAELIGPEVGVRADETGLLIHVRMVGTDRDISSVAIGRPHDLGRAPSADISLVI